MSTAKAGLVLVLMLAAASLSAPSASQTQTVPTVKREAAPIVRPDSGADMFKAYCASCHGPNGKGDGPAAPAMRTPPTDLTRLAAAHGGAFPTKDVSDVLRVGSPLPAHGSADMPIWGAAFRAMDDEGIVTIRIANLIDHLKTLQGK
jgi:mono/diheme cytochrome c family protein